MRLLKKLASAAAAAVMAGGALLATAPGSYAASEPDPAPALLVEAPTCVSRPVYEVPGGFDVFMTNRCGRTMYVRVIVDWAPDSVCIELLNNQSRTWHYQGVTGQYDHLALC
ncbi:hypothetical protein [Streptosporangium carneum]|uniref:Secreted protein n=1 Tax=Streptosporangium carneum TaxID=47481 RepID=A0A9W6MDE1_9ACTN|nr:hypothetical protein [Streptosporangium carneum]GLK09835.1 hypothetical protein GCM10017600_32410 [Streptosporangium carneum]